MSPKRLSETGDPFHARLLRAGKSDGPPPGSDARVLASLGIAVGAVSLLRVRTSGTMLWKWVGLSIFVGGATALAFRGPHAASEAAPPPVASEPLVVAIAPPPVQSDDVTFEAPAPSQISRPKAPPKARRAPSAALPAPRSAARDSLDAELALLRSAKAAVHDDPTRALATLDRHAQLFPKGLLREEAAVVRIDALVAAGEPARAASEARRFLSTYPQSAYAQRVRSLLEGPARSE